MPEWMDALIKVSHFIHFFRGEMRLPASTLSEIHTHTKQNILKEHLENIVVIRNIPTDLENYSRKWFVKRLFDLFKTHQVRVIDPQKDISFIPDKD